MLFWILHISRRHGERYSLHLSEADASEALYAYCLDEWDEGLSDQYGRPDRLTPEDCIEAYFDAWDKALDPEWYRLEPCVLHATSGRTDRMQALETAIQALVDRLSGGNPPDADAEAAIATARDALAIIDGQLATYPELIEALDMATTALNQVPGFDTGILCQQTGRSLNNYQLLPRLEWVLQQARGHQDPQA